ncbi:ABC transporter ATP-binding protein [Marinomonas foliarum]|uniref:ABC transporter ATP-binding protein n=1 Tax=Marinomonas foliarum TaxID=491950 RepID=A0ABX7IJA3_9GAMM|nr:ABC transporter ATP-binding protein [Marinomonas foliarum]QRV22400.1 ABC transporter ATP-binding protein [Marinomonas foliarum]
MSSVELTNLDKHYNGFHVLKDINLTIEKGEFIVMVGPSGCGKSTLLKTIAGLENITAGSLFIKGRDVTNVDPGERDIAMVFQSYALYPHMTVGENMGFGLRMAKRPKEEITLAVKRAAEILRITEQLDKYPKQLSGGQRQRVAIGRAITRSPEVFLFDEPLSNLDAALRTQMRVELSTLHARLGSTMIYVTHDQVEAMTMASRIVVLNAGHIEQVGSPLELYTNPINLFVAGFLGAPRMNFFKGKVEKTNAQHALISVKGLPLIECPLSENGESKLKVSDIVTLGIRPENLRLRNLNNNQQDIPITATVKLVEQLGRETVLYVDAQPIKAYQSDTGTEDLTVQIPAMVPLRNQSKIELAFQIENLYLFAPDGATISPQKIIKSESVLELES